MKRIPVIIPVLLAVITFAFTSCVPARKFEELKSKQERCEVDNATLKADVEKCNTELNELKVDMEDLQKSISALTRDTAVMGTSLRTMSRNYDKLNQTYDQLLDKNKELLEMSAADRRKMLGELNQATADIQKKEDELKTLELTLTKKEENLNKLTKELEASQKELEAREMRVKELESVLNRKDSAVAALRKKVADALLGFEDEGLTIEQKNGKVYVTLENQLLFKSGRYDVDQKGQEAIKKLAKVLEQNPDINIMVEGHTDDVPYNGGGAIKDNWDLSVKRATSIVKLITDNSKVDPKRLIAAGRGEYMPIDPAKTPEARKKNRRTEIILTPKLDELFKILEN